MNIVFTCGGTGGHIYPAIAVARMFRERQPDCRILFIGAEDGMENKLVPREGFELQTVQISNYQRKLTPAAIWHNLVTVQRMSATFAKTKRILKDFQPDVIVGTGGYASFPALKMGAKLGIPTCVHESNAVPGLTTKLVARTASRIMVSFDASRQHYPDPEKVLLTGTPCIMVPSQNVTGNHQEKNARVLEDAGAAAVVREADCDGRSLYETAKAILSDPERTGGMRTAARGMAVVDAAERIYQTAIELARG